jgi:hypothetical protein
MGSAERIQNFFRTLSRRWRRLSLWRLLATLALGTGLLWLAALVAAWLVTPYAGLAQVPLVLVTALATLVWTTWVIWTRAAVPSPSVLARLVEDRYPGLEDRLATAVDLLRRRDGGGDGGPLDAALLADAANQLGGLDQELIVARASLRRARRHALLALALMLVTGIAWFGPAKQAFRAAWLYVSPDRLVLEVSPGDARVPPATPFTVDVRSSAAEGGLVPELHVSMGEASRTVRMNPAGDDRFTVGFESVPASFTYRVSVAGRSSPDYSVTLLERPRVAGLDLTYEYPEFTKLPPRTERDGGDIYAPEGTQVRVSVRTATTTADVIEAEIAVAEGDAVPLTRAPDGRFEGTLALSSNTSYRIRLVDADGLENSDDPEYYVRLLDDRPPDVRILRPAGDRQVTPLEEVTIEARADDDHGVESFELVYSVRGGDERAVPLGAGASSLSVTGRHTVYLEDLDVEPGDFVSFFARARDVGRGKRPTEASSDIYFLEVTPFVDEFALAQSQAMAGAAGNQGMDDLVRIQKDIIVGTWKLEKRAASREGGPSAQDAQTLGRAQADLQQRTEMASRQSQMFGRRGRDRRAMPIEDDESALAAAAEAMGKAAESLEAVKIASALPSEMEALNHLLRAQAEVQRKQIAQQQGGGGGGGFNRAQQDLSALFDRELRRQQQTNYETPQSAQEEQAESGDDLLERVRELARRQEALARQQEDLARQRDRLEEEELRRRLERLSRDQTELQRQADQLSQQLAQAEREQRAQQSAGQQNQSGQSGQQQSGEQRAGQSSGQQSGEQSGQPSQGSSAMRQASEDMKGAASELRREEADAARERSARALERLREVERQLRQTGPDQRRRALGDAQLEARQLADRQRQLAEDAAGSADEPGTDGAGSEDRQRRLAGAQRELAERAEALGERLRELAGASPGGAASEEARLEAAVRDLENERIGERMREVADDIEAGDRAAGRGEPQRELARSLDRLADRVAGTTAGRDEEGQRLADDLSRARELRERLAELERQMSQIGREMQEGQPGGQQGGRGGDRSQPGETERQARRLADLRREYGEQLQRAGDLGQSLGEQNPGVGRGMNTPEGQEMVTSAPGTEAFKQDFSEWESLHQDVTLRLEQLEAALSQRLLQKAARERLRTGLRDATPEEYRVVVERYYRALAANPTER